MEWFFALLVALFPPLVDGYTLGMRLVPRNETLPPCVTIQVWIVGDYNGSGSVDLRDVAWFQLHYPRPRYGMDDWATMADQIVGPGIRTFNSRVAIWLIRDD